MNKLTFNEIFNMNIQQLDFNLINRYNIQTNYSSFLEKRNALAFKNNDLEKYINPIKNQVVIGDNFESYIIGIPSITSRKFV